MLEDSKDLEEITEDGYVELTFELKPDPDAVYSLPGTGFVRGEQPPK
ncbi:hypothetical protein [Nocardia mexicana]|uniref:Uncharacterized protein n=1 Tax=Nocardia mexicana TaxID=279262 RepID=A0A370HG58_9NOCA|nr:hypothetical protein [Nocardia mexicana]RDI56052.1 hypothetical protein DFR68_101889 [Nocardia mexicana]